MKKLIITVILLAGIALNVFAQTTPESEFTVERSSDGRSITITGYTGTSKTVNIPLTIQGIALS